MAKRQVRSTRRRARAARRAPIASAARPARVARALGDLVPPAARAHLRRAGREVALAVRHILDHAIARAQTAVRGRGRGLRRVRVE